MNLRKATQIFLTLICICFAGVSFSQSTIRLGASADKHNIVLGEQFVLTLKVDQPANAPISFFEIDSIPHFEILSAGPVDTTLTQNGISITQQLQLTSFDSGSRVIPSFNLPRNRRMVTPAIPIEVGYSKPFDPKAEYHGIKDILGAEVKRESSGNWWYLLGAGLLLALSLVYIFYKKKTIPEPVVIHKNAFELAMKDLEALNVDEHPKVFFTKLGNIFREYLEKRKGIYSMQKTTDDLVVQLKDIHMQGDDFARISQTLRLSDYVKFAKYPASQQEMTDSLQVIKSGIQDIEKTSEKVL